jgi:CDP-glucose 4,6-dehydratase
VNAPGRYAGVPVLVTGAQGFIGSWLARRLLDDGARVVVPRRESDALLDERCEAVAADILNRGSLVRMLDRFEIRSVFHLAGVSTVEAAQRDPFAAFEANVRGTYTLLDACRSSPAVERIVVASSHLVAARLSPYDVSKASAEAISRSYAEGHGLPVAVLRLANVYGGGDMNFTRLVPETARALVLGEQPVLRSDGTPRHDFLYVEDAVEAYLAVAASLDDEGARGRAWDAGTGVPVPVIEVVCRLIAAAGLNVEPRVNGSAGRAAHWDGVDGAPLRDELGWLPRWELDQGLRETYRWYERRLGRSPASTSP